MNKEISLHNGLRVSLRSIAKAILIAACSGCFPGVAHAQSKCHGESWSYKRPRNQAEFESIVKPLDQRNLTELAIGESLKREGSESLAPVLWSYLAQQEKKPKTRGLYLYMRSSDLMRMPAAEKDPMAASDAETLENLWSRKLIFKQNSKQDMNSLCAKFAQVFK